MTLDPNNPLHARVSMEHLPEEQLRILASIKLES